MDVEPLLHVLYGIGAFLLGLVMIVWIVIIGVLSLPSEEISRQEVDDILAERGERTVADIAIGTRIVKADQ